MPNAEEQREEEKDKQEDLSNKISTQNTNPIDDSTTSLSPEKQNVSIYIWSEVNSSKMMK